MNIILCSISALQNPKESAKITLLLLAKELQKQGHTVIIVAPRRKCMKNKEILDGITMYRYSSLLSLPFAIRNIQQCECWKADVIHGFSAALLFEIPLFLSKIFSPHVKVLLSLKSYSRSKMGMLGASLIKLVDTVTVPTNTHAHIWGIKNYEILRSPIDTKFKILDKKKLKEKYGFANKKIILYYGALWKDKGVDVLLKAIPKIVEKEKDFQVLILPRYIQIQPQQKLVRRLQIGNYVKFITEDVVIEEYVNLAEMIVLPYRNLRGTEGNPSCLLEAMACGTPVVTSDLPELREIAEGSVEFVRSGDPQKLAEKIVQLIKHPDPDKIKAGVTVARKFSAQKVAKSVEEIYTRILAALKVDLRRNANNEKTVVAQKCSIS